MPLLLDTAVLRARDIAATAQDLERILSGYADGTPDLGTYRVQHAIEAMRIQLTDVERLWRESA